MCLNLIKKLESLKITKVYGVDTMIPLPGNEYNQFSLKSLIFRSFIENSKINAQYQGCAVEIFNVITGIQIIFQKMKTGYSAVTSI